MTKRTITYDRTLLINRMMGARGGSGRNETYREWLKRSGAVCTRIIEPGQRASAPSSPAAIPEEPKRAITIEEFSAAFKR